MEVEHNHQLFFLDLMNTNRKFIKTAEKKSFDKKAIEILIHL